MRPRTLDEILGQDHILAPGRILRRSIEEDRIPSMILWEPPGSGKTTLAEVIARQTQARFATLSAVSAGVADLRKVVEDAGKYQEYKLGMEQYGAWFDPPITVKNGLMSVPTGPGVGIKDPAALKSATSTDSLTA